jgi:peptide/nickel transport system permease protein
VKGNGRFGLRRQAFWLPAGWISLMLFAALTAEWWPIPAFDDMDWAHLAQPPAGRSAHWLGTDAMGRDILSRLVYGARISLSVGLASPLIGCFFGGFLGCLAGYLRGRTDALVVAAMDVVLAFPGLVLLLAVAYYRGPRLENIVLTLGLLSVPAFARVARARTIALRKQPFVLAARLSGAGHATVLVREIIPNVVIPLTAYAMVVVAFMIMAEGALSFLGLGVASPAPSWGGMIAEGREVLDTSPHVSMIPAGVMFLTVLSFNLIGDALRGRAEQGRSQI